MYSNILSFFLGFKKIVSNFDYKIKKIAVKLRALRLNFNHVKWIRRIIKSKALVYLPVVSLSVKLYINNIELKKAEKVATEYKTQAQGRLKNFDDFKVSYTEKKKIGDRFLNIASNNFYNKQILSKLNKHEWDLLGREDKIIQDSTSAKGYKEADIQMALIGQRKWSRQWFIIPNDTTDLAVFRFRRIDMHQDTIIGVTIFDLDKLKLELNLKDK